MKKLTVGKLKKALENVPDELEIELWSDTGVDQCDDEDFELIVEDAYRNTYEDIDFFVIYANFREEEMED